MVVDLERYEDRVIVFIDILGFREHIKRTTIDQSHFKNLRDTLNFISTLKTANDGEEDKEVTVFSDSIVISYPVKLPGSVFWLLLDIIHIQLEMARKGILMRGGVAVGQLCHIDKIVYGPAMVEAFELENKTAIYPRVIISEQVFRTAIQYPGNSPMEDLELIGDLVKQDLDGLWYVDFLRQREEVDYEYDYFKALHTVKKLIEDEIKLNETKTDVRMKYEWLKSYFNQVADELPEDLELYIANGEGN